MISCGESPPRHFIEPLVTLFHWDLPYELQLRGAWLNPECADRFSEYTRVVVDALSDRVTYWNTQEEPVTCILLGYRTGELAPGFRLPLKEVIQSAHHTMLAHGKSVQAVRARARKTPFVTCAATGKCCVPASAAEAVQ
jgi:beta-glucosidase